MLAIKRVLARLPLTAAERLPPHDAPCKNAPLGGNVKIARRKQWNLLVWIACAACSSSGGDDTGSMLQGAMPSPGLSAAPAAAQPSSSSAGTPSVSIGAAGRPAASGAAVMTSPAAMASAAGAKAAAASGGAGATAAAGGGAPTGAAAGSAAAAVTPTAGSNAAAGSAAAAGSGSEGASSFKRPCVSAGNEVVFIGDSYSDYPIAHASLASFMEALAVKDGALDQGDNYRNLAEAGTTLAAAPAAIQTQWEGAKATKPIKAVVMTGGGNDVLINNQQCRAEGSEMRPDCQQVVQASMDVATKMFADMKAAGVSDVLFFWYPHIPGGLLTGGERGVSISDYTYPMLVDIAKAASTDTFHAYMVPTVQIFEGHPEYFYSDGLHANDAGEAKIADAVWAVMKENCIAQSSGCCMP
jgi:lysophospholipase L1-like esterase